MTPQENTPSKIIDNWFYRYAVTEPDESHTLILPENHDDGAIDELKEEVNNLIIEELESAINAPLKGKIWVNVPEKDNLITYLKERVKDYKGGQIG